MVRGDTLLNQYSPYACARAAAPNLDRSPARVIHDSRSSKLNEIVSLKRYYTDIISSKSLQVENLLSRPSYQIN